MSSSASVSVPQEASTYDELSMHQSMIFSDSLKDLKNLRAQLYSAAEYFELSYINDAQKQIVVKTLKDYTVQALVNTVDHLGSVTYKITGLLDEQVDEVSGTELKVSCIEQRLRSCQKYIDREGITQQSLVITAPKYHKRYILPGKSMNGSGRDLPKWQDLSKEDEDDWHVLRNAIRSTIRETHSSAAKKERSLSPSKRQGSFAFAEKSCVAPIQRSASSIPRSISPSPRSISPLPSSRPLSRSGSLAVRSTSPNPVNAVRQFQLLNLILVLAAWRATLGVFLWKGFALSLEFGHVQILVYGIHPQHKSLHRCDSMQRRMVKQIYTLAKVNDYSEPCSVDERPRMIQCCILTWTSIKDIAKLFSFFTYQFCQIAFHLSNERTKRYI